LRQNNKNGWVLRDGLASYKMADCSDCNCALGKGICKACVREWRRIYDKPAVAGKRVHKITSYAAVAGVSRSALLLHNGATFKVKAYVAAAKKRLNTVSIASPTKFASDVRGKSYAARLSPSPDRPEAPTERRKKTKTTPAVDGFTTPPLPLEPVPISTFHTTSLAFPISSSQVNESFNYADSPALPLYRTSPSVQAKSTQPVFTASAQVAAVTTLSRPSAPPSKSKTNTNAVPRAVSTTVGEDGLPLNHAQLKQLVTKTNARMPKTMQIKGIGQMSIAAMDSYMKGKIDEAATASLVALDKAAIQRMSQSVCREICMRMLCLLATDPELLSLYQAQRAGSTQREVDAGNDPKKNTGQGMGMNHAYYPAMVAAFNDMTVIVDFPFEYFAPTPEPFHTDGITTVHTPPQVRSGFFAGLGLKQPRLPLGFPQDFFNAKRLDEIFIAGLKEYHNALANATQSGNHGGLPLWFFVAPCRTIVPEEQANYLFDKQKRWDTLAFHCMSEHCPALASYISPVVPGGKGGSTPSTPTDISAPPPGSSSRVVSAHGRQKQEMRDAELHELRKADFAAKAEARLGVIDAETGKMQKVLEYIELSKQFTKAGETDMADHCTKQASVLKLSILARASPIATTTGGGNTPLTPLHDTPRGTNKVLSPLTPLPVL
jgi:hypothetical protein